MLFHLLHNQPGMIPQTMPLGVPATTGAECDRVQVSGAGKRLWFRLDTNSGHPGRDGDGGIPGQREPGE
jgi:hypothetical protein